MQPAGILALGAGAVLVIIGLRGTQKAALPGLFTSAADAAKAAAKAAPKVPNVPVTPPLVPLAPGPFDTIL